MISNVAPPPLQTTNAPAADQEELQSPSRIKSLLGSWEKRASASSGMPDVARLALSPQGVSRKKVVPKPPPPPAEGGEAEKKSTRQAMEDLSLFVSPRQIKKKFVAPSKNSDRQTASSDKMPETMSTDQRSHEEVPSTPTPIKAAKKVSAVYPPTPPPPAPPQVAAAKVPDDVPQFGSIRERMKAFERNKQENDNQAPWISQNMRGKRGSVLDKFTPKATAKEKVLSKRKEKEELPQVDLLRQESVPEEEEETSVGKASEKEEQDDECPTLSLDDIKASIATVDDDSDLDAHVETEPESAGTDKNGKIDRDTLVLGEIRKIIRDTEDNEMEDEMDEEIKGCLEKAALQSPAYTRRWYDAFSDSWIHCPSLASIIMDFTLIEAAEELYGEELPMLYTVSLRAVASEVMQEEEELPEYVLRLAF